MFFQLELGKYNTIHYIKPKEIIEFQIMILTQTYLICSVLVDQGLLPKGVLNLPFQDPTLSHKPTVSTKRERRKEEKERTEQLDRYMDK